MKIVLQTQNWAKTLSQTLILNGGQFFSGEIVWLPPNPKTNPDLDPNPKPNRGAIVRIPSVTK